MPYIKSVIKTCISCLKWITDITNKYSLVIYNYISCVAFKIPPGHSHEGSFWKILSKIAILWEESLKKLVTKFQKNDNIISLCTNQTCMYENMYTLVKMNNRHNKQIQSHEVCYMQTTLTVWHLKFHLVTELWGFFLNNLI